MNKTRYFQAQGCNRWPELFIPFDTLGGVLWGFCAVDTPEKLSQIEALLKTPKLGVSEITEGEYDKLAQKKMSSLPGSPPWSPSPVPSSASPVPLVEESKAATTPWPSPPTGPGYSAVKGRGTVQIDTDGSTPSPEPAVESGKPVPSLAEALQTGPVDPPPTAKPKNSRKLK